MKTVDVFYQKKLALNQLIDCRHRLEEALIGLGLPAITVSELLVVVCELITNAVKYQKNKQITCQIVMPAPCLGNNSLQIKLNGMEYLSIPNQDSVQDSVFSEEIKEGGRGLWIASHLVDGYRALPENKGVCLIKSWDTPYEPGH